MVKKFALACSVVVLLSQCSNKEAAITDPYAAIKAKFPTTINPTNLADYTQQGHPVYITKDNTGTNSISNAGATLGRVLFYDKNLSSNNSIACASCHKQANAFGDTPIQSQGVNGVTGRHAMRLVNSRFSAEVKFFWDERAPSLEAQTTRPIQDHKEMGYSGNDGDQNLTALIAKLQSIDYYNELFKLAYGNNTITEARMQNALAQFVRSIQSFDSKYDVGRSTAPNDGAPFINFTTLENQGKNLFLTPPQFDANSIRIGGGAGCQGCHQAPEFDIAPNSGNNGVVGIAGGTGTDFTNTRSPSLRNILNGSGAPNGPFMHDGSKPTIESVIEHYNKIVLVPGNTLIDPKLTPGGKPHQLNLTQNEKDALVAFLKTLTGTNVYTDARWSDPFK
ncbi:MAG TPA: cytochrome c peroxidase [Cyclobacteriaceae bacterium]|nr:cytochrome c peroxidase [Cyclobacteriaceae bacterium]